jgi:hypothetical protein
MTLLPETSQIVNASAASDSAHIICFIMNLFYLMPDYQMQIAFWIVRILP